MQQVTQKRNKKVLPLFLILILVSSIILIQYADAVGTTFTGEVSVNGTNLDSTIPQIISADGTDVYVVWRDIDTTNNDPEVLFAKSTDNGATFSNAINITSTLNLNTISQSTVPQIAISGNNVYVVWQDEDAGATDIYLSVSSDDGDTFGVPVNLSNGASFTGNSVDPQIAVNGTNVYVIWRDFSEDTVDGDIYFRNSTNNGSTFTPSLATNPPNLSTSNNEESLNAKVAATGNSVYIVWEEGDSEQVAFRGSADNGSTFTPALASAPTDISAGRDGDGLTPAFVVSGSNIHVIFEDDTLGAQQSVVYRRISDDGGGTFSFLPSLASAGTTVSAGTGLVDQLDIAASGNRVYAAWQDILSGGVDFDIFFSNSTDNGASFSTQENISDNAGNAFTPQVTASGDNVYLTWSDSTGGDTEILLQASFATGGTEFGSTSQLTDDSNAAVTPQVSADGSNIYVVWDEDVTGSNSEILLRAGTISSIDIAFDSAQYRLTETATITITAPNSNTNPSSPQQIAGTITSDTDTTGITVTFTETGNDTNDFTASITFNTTGSTGSELETSPNETITASFGAQTGTATIFSRTADFNGFTGFTLGSTAAVRVTDQNSNTDSGSAEQVTVTVSSTNAPTSASNPITMTITETGVNTGIFGTTLNTALIFQNGYAAITIDEDITVTETTVGGNPTNNAAQIDTATVNVESSTSDVDITVTETGINTGIFQEIIKFITGATSGTSIQAAGGDYIRLEFEGFESRILLLPNSNSSKGALQVSVTDTIDDTITISFGGASSTGTVSGTGGQPGGGGGGLVRPTIVLNAVLGASAIASILGGGGGSDHSPPISTLDIISKSRDIDVPDHIREIIENQKPGVPINPLENESFDLPLSINEKGYPLGASENTIVTNQIQIGEPIKFKMLFYEQRDLEHVSIYMNLRDGKRSDQSDAFIIYEKRSPMEIVDKNGFFGDINFEIIEGEDNKKFAVFEINFIKAMDTSDIVFKSWDFDRRGVAVLVHDAIKVEELPSENKIEDTVEETSKEILDEKKPVPDWVKSNAKGWGDGQIDDETFINGIGFLISEKIIDVPVEANVSKEKDDDSEIIEEEAEQVKVPDWVKNNAKWWGENQIDEGTFLSAIEYLVKNEIITIS